jgi:hypothetical protein
MCQLIAPYGHVTCVSTRLALYRRPSTGEGGISVEQPKHAKSYERARVLDE